MTAAHFHLEQAALKRALKEQIIRCSVSSNIGIWGWQVRLATNPKHQYLMTWEWESQQLTRYITKKNLAQYQVE